MNTKPITNEAHQSEATKENSQQVTITTSTDHIIALLDGCECHRGRKFDFDLLSFATQVKELQKNLKRYKEVAPSTFADLDKDDTYCHLIIQIRLKEVERLLK